MLSGAKVHEVRRLTDRDYQVGDRLRLQEYDPITETYSGRELVVRITYTTSADAPCALSENLSASQFLHTQHRQSAATICGGIVNRIVAVSGLCGAGKSTAVRLLAEATGGEVIYFGATVLRAMRERGLPETSASEQIVRIELRDQHGPACLAMLEAERIKTVLAERRYVLLDAVYCCDEFEYLSGLAAEFSLIGIEASFSTRLARLGVRATRPMTEPQLHERDTVDLTRLKTDNVLAKASVLIRNEGSMAEFGSALSRMLVESSV